MGAGGMAAAAGPAARAGARAVTEESEHTAGRDGTGADVPSRPRAHCSLCHPLMARGRARLLLNADRRRPSPRPSEPLASLSRAPSMAPMATNQVPEVLASFFRKRIPISSLKKNTISYLHLFDLSVVFYIHGTV